MNSKELLFEAMGHLESIDGTTPTEETLNRVAAAHYLIQAATTGHRPDNFNAILAQGRMYDEAEDAIQVAKQKGIARN